MITALRAEVKIARARFRSREDVFYRDAQYLAATYELDRKIAKRWLPPGLMLPRQAKADLFIASFPKSFIGEPYLEAGLFVHVRTPFGTGIHCPWMIVDNDVALTLGREGGYPKKAGEFEYRIEGDQIFAQASRRGTKLITMRGTIGERVVDPEPFIGRSNLHVVGSTVSIPRLVWFKPIERHVGTREAELDVEISGSLTDPLTELGLGKLLSCRLNRVDLLGVRPPPIPLYPIPPTYTATNFRIRTT